MRRFFQDIGVPEEEWMDRGLDFDNTPKRVAKMFQDELLSSYKPGAEQALIDNFTCFASAEDDGLVTEGPFDWSSLCAHHALPFVGEAYVGYLPGEAVIGASKLARVVTFYSRMFQIQERMARQVADFILLHSGAAGVFVTLKARHFCMVCRGVKQTRANMLVTAVRPLDIVHEMPHVLQEYYNHVKLLSE